MQEFEQLRNKQWEKGRVEYGQTFYLTGLDLPGLFSYYYEELVDIANYGAMLYAKLRALEEHLVQGGFIAKGGPDEADTNTSAKSA